jgi:hypothetical protein
MRTDVPARGGPSDRPYWAGALSGDALLIGGHVLMLPAMVVAMPVREDECTRPIHVPAQPTETDHEH